MADGYSADDEAEAFETWLRHRSEAVRTLRAQSLDVLRALFARRGRVVPRAALFDRVWGDHVVTDDSLVQCIGEIRRAIGDDARMAIRTYPRRGYLLELHADAEPGGAHPATLPTIAVLPFSHVGGRRGRIVAHGLTEDLATELSRHKEFLVLAHHSVRRLEGLERPPDELAAELGVRYTVRGSVQERGEAIVVNVHVTDVRTRTLVWSERYDEVGDDVFAAQDRVVVRVVNRLGGGAGVVVSSERRRFGAAGAAALDAYDHYILGSDTARYFTAAGSADAVVHLGRAVRADPGFSKAWSRLAIVHLVRLAYTYTDDPDGTSAALVGAACRAVEADPSDSFAHAVAGGAHFQAGDAARGRDAFERALANGASNADTLAAVAYIRPTKLPTAAKDLENVRRAMALNPLRPMWYSLAFGYCAYYAGAFREAADELSRVDDDVLDKHLYRTLCLAELGETEALADGRARLLAMRPGLSLRVLVLGDAMHDADAVRQLGRSFALAGLPI